MAKGVEDTAFYRYNRLISLNEVGGDPGAGRRGGRRGSTPAARPTTERLARRPADHCPPTTPSAARTSGPGSTSCRRCPGAWRRRSNGGRPTTTATGAAARPTATPSTCSTRRWSAPGPSTPSGLLAYMEKATREAKVHTSWVEPDPGLRRRRAGLRRARAGRRRSSWPTSSGSSPSRSSLERAASTRWPRRPCSLTAPGRARPLPGHRGLGPQPGRPRQPPAGRLRRSPARCSAAVRSAAAGRRSWPSTTRAAAKLWLTTAGSSAAAAGPDAYRPVSQYRPARGQRASSRTTWSPSGARADCVTVVPRLPLGVDLGRAWGDTVSTCRRAWTDGADRRRRGRGPGRCPCATLLAGFPVAVLGQALMADDDFRVWAPRPAQVDRRGGDARQLAHGPGRTGVVGGRGRRRRARLGLRLPPRRRAAPARPPVAAGSRRASTGRRRVVDHRRSPGHDQAWRGLRAALGGALRAARRHLHPRRHLRRRHRPARPPGRRSA